MFDLRIGEVIPEGDGEKEKEKPSDILTGLIDLVTPNHDDPNNTGSYAQSYVQAMCG